MDNPLGEAVEALRAEVDLLRQEVENSRQDIADLREAAGRVEAVLDQAARAHSHRKR